MPVEWELVTGTVGNEINDDVADTSSLVQGMLGTTSDGRLFMGSFDTTSVSLPPVIREITGNGEYTTLVNSADTYTLSVRGAMRDISVDVDDVPLSVQIIGDRGIAKWSSTASESIPFVAPAWPVPMFGDSRFADASGVTIDEDGNYYVYIDRETSIEGQHQIWKYDGSSWTMEGSVDDNRLATAIGECRSLLLIPDGRFLIGGWNLYPNAIVHLDFENNRVVEVPNLSISAEQRGVLTYRWDGGPPPFFNGLAYYDGEIYTGVTTQAGVGEGALRSNTTILKARWPDDPLPPRTLLINSQATYKACPPQQLPVLPKCSSTLTTLDSYPTVRGKNG